MGRPNSRVADAMARWAAAVERETVGVISDAVKETVNRALADRHGEAMPLSRSRVEEEIASLAGADRKIAKLAILLAKAPYQVDEGIAGDVMIVHPDEATFIRILAWASFTAARRFIQIVARRSGIRPPLEIVMNPV